MPRDGGAGSDQDPANRWVDFRGEKRSNATHESKADPEARLVRKGAGQSSMLAHSLHVLMENRNGLIMNLEMSEADGQAERDAALMMLEHAKASPTLDPGWLGRTGL